MRLFVFNVAKSLLELLLHAYLPWLDPLRYLDVSRSALLSRNGYLKVLRRFGPLPLPIVWHSGSYTSLLSMFALCLSVSVFLLNQGAFEVTTFDSTVSATVLTCHPPLSGWLASKKRQRGKKGILNNREGITHLFRVTATCRHGNRFPAGPSWGDAKLSPGGTVLYGSATYLCRDPVRAEILAHVDFCYNGNHAGDSCTGNKVHGLACNVSRDLAITSAGIEKSSAGVLCTHDLAADTVLFWVGNQTQGVKISGIRDFAPTTLEILRRALAPPSSFLRSHVRRALDAEATVRDRPFCERGVQGRVRNGLSYSMLKIRPVWWLANAALGVLWGLLRRSGRVLVDFSATAVCDRLRAEMTGNDTLQPSQEDFLFGVTEEISGELHLGPLRGGTSTVVPPSAWPYYALRTRRRSMRKGKGFHKMLQQLSGGRGVWKEDSEEEE